MLNETYLALQVMMMPRDANPMPTLHGNAPNTLYMTIFGGILLSYIDQAGAIGARRAILKAGGTQPHLVTVALNRVEFLKPVHVGDVVRFLTHVVRIGNTSITVKVQVEADRGSETLQVTEAEVVYVNIDPATPDRRPRLILP